MSHNSKPKFRVILGLLSIAVLLVPAESIGQRRKSRSTFQKTNPKLLQVFQKVIAKPRQSVVDIVVDGEKVALGTVVDVGGYILTKASKLGENPEVWLDEETKLEAEIIGRKDTHDLALLKVDAKDLKPVEFRPSKQAPVGSWAISVGTDSDPVALGVVSVGMRNVKYRRVSNHGYMGINLKPEAKKAVIDRIFPRTGAAKAGLKKNDVILSVNKKAVSNSSKLIQLLKAYRPGDRVTVNLRRGEKEMDVEVTLGKRPLSRGDRQNQLGSKLSDRRTGFPTILQHDSVIDPTKCGGPLVDLDGKVIGINIARAGRTESYAIPAEVVQPLLEKLKAGRVSSKKESSGN